jgi:formylmethanofuran dehydrogenase subunit E
MTTAANATTCACSTLGEGSGGPDAAQDRVEEIVRFHGHMCPGLAMGIRAAEVALREIGPHSSDEEVVAIVETNMCAVDAIQYLTGCTFGKGNLIHLDYGKNAYTFIRRSDGRALRIAARPDALSWDPERKELLGKIQAKTADVVERVRFKELQRSRSRAVLEAPEEELHTVQEIHEVDVPAMARIQPSVICDECEEPTMETRVRRVEGRALCPPCLEEALRAEEALPS